ncbi:DUF934 domain-containing protein [Methylotenera versatilis]|uniref:DUF934 domain-containing protein n=1 Tax=Methylotenera versatilis TaxID=1055487 RepID=UPI0006483DE5|nr:DUF934 domain-containing protein [Methylotenera versatilis]
MLNNSLRLIRNGRLEIDVWRLFDADPAILPPDENYWMVKLETWKNHREQLSLRKFPVAILVPSDADSTDILFKCDSSANLEKIALIAIDFPTYTDGRGFSLAQILRKQYGWNGELRAMGDVLIDIIHYLARCGFDSFLIKEGHDAELALEAFETFTVHYQRSYPQPTKATT